MSELPKSCEIPLTSSKYFRPSVHCGFICCRTMIAVMETLWNLLKTALVHHVSLSSYHRLARLN